MYYVGDGEDRHGLKYGLRYGDEVTISPLMDNDTDFEAFGVYLANIRTGECCETLLSLKDLLEEFVVYDFDIDEREVPVKPVENKVKYCCSICKEPVTSDFSHCESCGQALDWEGVECAEEA